MKPGLDEVKMWGKKTCMWGQKGQWRGEKGTPDDTNMRWSVIIETMKDKEEEEDICIIKQKGS